ncbi:hypothetical protein ACFV3R_33145, partial [Streptomyces sp. NPDC059740]|uniref:hypothetical protein n=1 Tax=Streptomyces sp. NPDC059740 TaxID=3346926 RepID=UPI0036661D55
SCARVMQDDLQDHRSSRAGNSQIDHDSIRALELALAGAFQEQGHTLERTGGAPDFLIGGPHPVAIEATTSNPTQSYADTEGEAAAGQASPDAHPLVPQDPEGAETEFVFQCAKALRRKLKKTDAQGRFYWQKPHIEGRPFVIALESFHHPAALFQTIGPLISYLFGRRDVATRDGDGNLVLASEKIAEHRHNGNSIASGLFAQPEAAHLSSVIFSNSATIAKFHRMGTERGYGPDDVALVRYGMLPDPDPNADRPLRHAYVIGDYEAEDHETFSEGFHILHNPWAHTPIGKGVFPGFTEHRLREDGLILTEADGIPDFIVSHTAVFDGPQARAAARTYVGRALAGFRPSS